MVVFFFIFRYHTSFLSHNLQSCNLLVFFSACEKLHFYYVNKEEQTPVFLNLLIYTHIHVYTARANIF